MSGERVPFGTPIRRMQTEISWRCLLDISVDPQVHSCQRWNYRLNGETVQDRSSEMAFLQSGFVGFASSPTGWINEKTYANLSGWYFFHHWFRREASSLWCFIRANKNQDFAKTNLFAAAIFDRFFRISHSIGALKWIWNLNGEYFLVEF